MAAKGYCTPEEVAAYLSRQITAEQLPQLENTIEAAEAWIDDKLGFGFLGSAVVGRYRVAWNNEIYLGPISDIESLQYYAYGADVPYTIIDSNTGRVRIGYDVRDGTGFLVDYLPADTVPAKIKQACIILSAHWMMPTLDPDRFGVKQYAFSGDHSVVFDGSAVQEMVLTLIGAGGDVALA